KRLSVFGGYAVLQRSNSGSFNHSFVIFGTWEDFNINNLRPSVNVKLKNNFFTRRETSSVSVNFIIFHNTKLSVIRNVIGCAKILNQVICSGRALPYSGSFVKSFQTIMTKRRRGRRRKHMICLMLHIQLKRTTIFGNFKLIL